MPGAVRNADRMNQRRVRVWHSAGRVRRKTAPTGVGVVIPFLKVYIALTAPERTDSQSMLQRTDSQLCYKEETQTRSLCYNFNQKWCNLKFYLTFFV